MTAIIKNNEELFYKHLDFLPTPVLICRLNPNPLQGQTLYVNKAFTDTIGYSVGDIADVNTFLATLYPDKQNRKEVICDWIRKTSRYNRRKTSLVQLNSKILCKDQSYRWFEIRTELKNTIDKDTIIILFNNIDKTKNEALQYAQLSRVDSLTGLANRRHMLQSLEKEHAMKFHAQDSMSFSTVMCDIDFFKGINDTYGHACGDYVLEQVSSLIKASIRKIDKASRWGGEEFLLLLPKTNVTEARIVVKKLIKRLHEHVFTWEGHRIKVSMTYGITEHYENEQVSETIRRADNYLYCGKESGRDCIFSDEALEAWGS